MNKFILPIITFSFFLLIEYNCNYIPDNSFIADSTFTLYDKDIFFRFDTLYLFNTKHNHTVDFQGVYSCTLIVNNEITEVKEYDSIYQRITHLKDTIIHLGDSLLGRAGLCLQDINNWNVVKHHFLFPVEYLLGTLFSEYIADITLYNSIVQAFQNNSPLTELQKSEIVSALNDMISTCNLFERYREEILIEVEDTKKIEKETGRLIYEQIMIDTTGKLKSGELTEYEKEALKWFNLYLFKYLGTAPMEKTRMLYAYPVSQRVHTVLLHRDTSKQMSGGKKLKLFIGIDKTGLFLHGYIYINGGFTTNFYGDKITPMPFLTGTNWLIPPVCYPDIAHVPYENFGSLLLPGRAYMRYKRELSNEDSSRYEMTLYYPLNGTVKEGDGFVTIIGTLSIRIGFTKITYASNFEQVALLRAWDTEINIQKTYSDGQKKEYKEKIVLRADEIF